MSAAEDAVTQLVELGLNRNEALAYIALLEHDGDQGATGYEIGTHSGVPRSAVYKILNRLESLGAVFSVGVDPKRFVATAPDRFIAELQRTFTARVGRASESLSRLSRRPHPEPIWTVSRYEDVLDRIDAMIRSAQTAVYVSLWDRELGRLSQAFDAISERDLHLVLHSPGPVSAPPRGFSTWCGDIPRHDSKSAWSHRAIVVVDHNQALLGGTELDVDNHAVWTSNPSLVDLALNHMVLDITLQSNATGRPCGDDVAPMMRPHLPHPT